MSETDTKQDAEAVFDRVTRRELGISGADFLARWDAGDYEGVDVDDVDGLAEVVGALPFVR
ncbi:MULTISPECIES: hypothetical protein [Pseudonocardia]|uniref:hypothetical protein n=1 Tax=Pseudonocardia TaxID=1847 RepID=UPI001E4BA525|nr:MULTISPECIES: hypothetical protein [Pseudonocardia]